MAAARVAILGAGSVGCFIGGAWQAAGLPVTLIGRSAIADEVRRNGLTLSDYTGWQALLRDVDYRTGPSALGDTDVILLCVKSGATADAAAEIAAHGREGATVISFQNGISNVEVLSQALGDRFTVMRGVVAFNVAYLGKGHFHKGVGGKLYVDDGRETRALGQAVGSGPASVTVFAEMLSLAWGKLLINLNNAVNALSGRPLLEQLGERDYRCVVAACQREALKLLWRAGSTPARIGPVPPHLLPMVMRSPDWLFNNLFLKAWKIDATARSSMADDLAAGRRTEVDYLNGEFVRLAERLGTDAPVNRAIVELVRKAEVGAEALAPAALRKAALGG